MKTGIAHLPLHYGKAPAWLFQRMVKLAREIGSLVVMEHGADYFLERLSDPFWFQSFGCVLGFDWHSSGVTTTVCGALKEGLRGTERDLGIFVCGGKGGTSRKTPNEIETFSSKNKVRAEAQKLVYASKMSAKVDNTAVQDGFQLYQHCFIFSAQGNWTVIQQGMNEQTRWARRYHWLGSRVSDFVCEPHQAICCDHKVETLNMVDRESDQARQVSRDIAISSPEKIMSEFKHLLSLNLPRRHQVELSDVNGKHFNKILLSTYEKQPKDFETLLSLEGVGPKTIRALALISELVYGNPASYKDPARFSFAHGGKDGFPYPVNRKGYDTSIEVLHKAISDAKVGSYDKMRAIKRLQNFSK